MRIFTALFLLISTVIFLAHYFLIGQAVYGDGRFYYSYARSLALQGNLDIKDELSHIFSPQENNTESINFQSFEGYPIQSLGPSLYWAPVIAISHQIALKIGLLSNGYSDIYQISVGLLSIAFTGLAFHKLGSLLLKKVSAKVSFLVLILVWAGSNLFFYTAIDNINTHFFSFSLAVLALCEYLDNKKPSMIFAGLLAGIAVQNRQLDAIYHIGLLVAYLSNHKRISNLIIFLVSACISAMPQFLIWNFQFGSFFPPMGRSGLWSFAPLSLLSIFFNLPNGLIFTAPVLFLSILYLPFGFKNRYILSSTFSLIAFLVVTSMWWSPLGGAAYGPRFLIVFYPVLTLSLVEIVKNISFCKLTIYSFILVILSLAHTYIFLSVSP